MRFRHKLSIVLVGLAIIPLAATGVLIASLIEHDQVTRLKLQAYRRIGGERGENAEREGIGI